MEQQSDRPTSINDTLGMTCWHALELGLDWSGHWPLMDELTLRIVGVLDKSADTSEYFFVSVPDPFTWRMNGNDAAIRKKNPWESRRLPHDKRNEP